MSRYCKHGAFQSHCTDPECNPKTPSGGCGAMTCSPSSDVKPMGAVTISRNGYIQEVEKQRDDFKSALQEIVDGRHGAFVRAKNLLENV